MKILRYCYKLISLNKHGSFERLIGFSFLGFIFIYIMNLHYSQIKAAQSSGTFGVKSNQWEKLGQTTGMANFLVQ